MGVRGGEGGGEDGGGGGGENEKRGENALHHQNAFLFLHRKADEQYSEIQRLWSKTVT